MYYMYDNVVIVCIMAGYFYLCINFTVESTDTDDYTYMLR